MLKEKKHYMVLFLIAVVVAVGVFLLVRFLEEEEVKKPEIKWTRANALKPSAPPVLMDSRDAEALKLAVNRSLDYFGKIDPGTPMVFGPQTFTAGEVKESLEDFKKKLGELGLTESFFRYVTESFSFYRTAAPEALITGYYEAQLKGSRKKGKTYRYPLYRKPGDLVRIELSQFSIYEKFPDLPRFLRGRLSKTNRIVPYYSRKEIDSDGCLVGKKLELLWVDNPIDVFFLQIQGSGIVKLAEGGEVRVNYADSNGHPYRAIGRVLIDEGKITREEMSMQKIRQYLDEHPEELEDIFNYNPSYVFS